MADPHSPRGTHFGEPASQPAEKPAPPQTTVRRADPERTMCTCPICGKELAQRKCKLYCPDPICGYFLSCADYY